MVRDHENWYVYQEVGTFNIPDVHSSLFKLRINLEVAQNTNKTNYYNIDPLNGNNYKAWEFQIKMILTEHNVEQMISVKYRVENYETDQLREEAKREENKYKSILVQCVDDMQIDIIRDQETAYDM